MQHRPLLPGNGTESAPAAVALLLRLLAGRGAPWMRHRPRLPGRGSASTPAAGLLRLLDAAVLRDPACTCQAARICIAATCATCSAA
eukprot:2352836-Alexandrium_andersonii.AAC.1